MLREGEHISEVSENSHNVYNALQQTFQTIQQAAKNSPLDGEGHFYVNPQTQEVLEYTGDQDGFFVISFYAKDKSLRIMTFLQYDTTPIDKILLPLGEVTASTEGYPSQSNILFKQNRHVWIQASQDDQNKFVLFNLDKVNRYVKNCAGKAK